MKEFRLELASPPQGVYFPGMMVTGTVVCETDKPKDYKQIKVFLRGRADVHWSETHGSGENRRTEHYSSHEQYIECFTVLWDKSTNGILPVGVYRFNFSLQLSGANLPPSFVGTVGSIKYTVEARVVKDGLLKMDTTAIALINVANVVTVDRPELMQPAAMEVRKTICCLCCASAPIVITARIPRTGFCIGHDRIPVEVSVENGSNRTIQQIQASIHKNVVYTAQGRHRYDTRSFQIVDSQPIGAHNSTVFRPEPIPIPSDSIIPTLTNCGIISVNYFLQVTAVIPWAVNPHINIPIIIGNVPLQNQGGTAPMTGTGPFHSPVPMQANFYPTPPQQQLPNPAQDWNAPPPYNPEPPSQLPIGFVDPIRKS